MRSFFSLFCAMAICQFASAQRTCSTEQYARTIFKPQSQVSVDRGRERDTIPNEIITIPVVVHVIFKTTEQNISDDQVLSQIQVLNKDFRRLNADAVNTPAAFQSIAADSRIMFCLAQVTPEGRPTKGIVRRYTDKDFFLGDDAMKYTAAGGDDAWDSKKYLNIWVCCLFGRSLGYATPPGGQPDLDGVVINFDVFGTRGIVRAPFNLGRTATHEIGHWLGLKHLWGDVSCGSDDVDDTPRQMGYNYGCPSFPHVTSCSENGNGDMFMNFMDFSDDACMNSFSNGQKRKMRSLFALGSIKNSFLNSFACDSTLASGGPIPDDTIPVAKPRPEIMLYPNPVQSEVTIQPVNDYGLIGKVCSIFNVQGKRVFQQTCTSAKQKMNLSDLPSGVYILQVGTGNDKRIQKLLKL